MVVPFAILVVALLIAWGIHVVAKNGKISGLRNLVEALRCDKKEIEESKDREIERRNEQLDGRIKEILAHKEFLKTFVPGEQVAGILQALARRFHEVDMEERDVQQGKKQISSAERLALRKDLDGRRQAFHGALNLVARINEINKYDREMPEYPVYESYELYLPHEMQQAAKRR